MMVCVLEVMCVWNVGVLCWLVVCVLQMQSVCGVCCGGAGVCRGFCGCVVDWFVCCE